MTYRRPGKKDEAVVADVSAIMAEGPDITY